MTANGSITQFTWGNALATRFLGGELTFVLTVVTSKDAPPPDEAAVFLAVD